MILKAYFTILLVSALVACGGTRDITAPEVDAPSPITIHSSNGEAIPASDPEIANFLTSATATDDVDGTITTINNDAPTSFPIGTTQVTFSATDSAGNTGTSVSSVTITEATYSEVIFFQETDSVGGQVERNQIFLVSIDEGSVSGSANIEVLHQWPNDMHAQEGSPAYLTKAGLALVSGASFDGFPSVSGVLPSQATPVRHGTGAHGVLRLLDPSGSIAWQYIRCDYEDNGSGGLSAGEYCLHHDVEPMPNGNILTYAHRKVPRATLEEQAGWLNNSSAEFLWVETVFELRPVFGPESEEECLALGQMWSTEEPWCTEEVWSLDLLNYLGSATDDPSVININLLDATTRSGGTKFVQLHINSISYNESRDEIILSSLLYGEFFIFDRATKEMVYRWGNPKNYQCNGATDPDICGQVTQGQHDVSWVNDNTIRIHNNNQAPGPGNTDDEDCLAGDCSKVIVINLPLDENGNYILENNMPYSPFPYLGTGDGYQVLYGPYSTVFASGAKRFSNGDVLLTKTNSRELRRVRVTDPAGTDTGTGPGTTGDWIWNTELPYLDQPIDSSSNIYQTAECYESPMFGYSCAQIFKAQLYRTDSDNIVNFNNLKNP
ncbi:aryl-sulfate sulfotransferase [Pleionea sediminis]|uniref:aryl-sulfate sulfotransferase n=1 Tax=Pleionea sediminis TaxID=2569479 RepID=UPI0013DE52FF|nr:aryl-sulfate sulfotransferase [Pleionea sediminis]